MFPNFFVKVCFRLLLLCCLLDFTERKIMVKHLIQGRNNDAWVGIEPSTSRNTSRLAIITRVLNLRESKEFMQLSKSTNSKTSRSQNSPVQKQYLTSGNHGGSKLHQYLQVGSYKKSLQPVKTIVKYLILMRAIACETQKQIY